MRRLLAALLLVAPLGAPCPADVVYTKDGRRIEGKVVERGAEVEVVQPLGRVQLRRAEIASIHYGDEGASTAAEGPGAPTEGSGPPQDVIILRSGKILRGSVRVDEGRSDVFIDFGDRGTMHLPRSEVKSIVWADRGAVAAEGVEGEAGLLASTVDALVGDLVAGDASREAAARSRLLDLAVFAIPDLERHLARFREEGEGGAGAASRVQQVLLAIQFRGLIPEGLAAAMPDLEARALGADPAGRLALVRQLLLDHPEEGEPVLDFLVRQDDQTPELRSAIIEGFRVAERNRPLLGLLADGPPSVRLAAALALGDNGVLVGIPILIEALRLESPAIRALAIQRLERYTGEFLDYFPEDPPEKRQQAVDRWEQWWTVNGEQVVRQSLRGTLRSSEISDTDRTEARKFWSLAHEFWDRAEASEADPAQRDRDLATAAYYFRAALEEDPAHVPSRINLAVVLYTSAASEPDWEEAERELQAVLERYARTVGSPGRHTALYHLGRLYARWGRWADAVRRLREAVREDPDAVLAWTALGEALLAQSLRDPALQAEGVDPAERRSGVAGAAEAFGKALDAADRLAGQVDQAERDNERLALEDTVHGFTSAAFRGALRAYLEDLDRQRAAAHHGLGAARVAEQDVAGAVEHFGQAARLDPLEPSYQEDLEWWTAALDVAAPEFPEGPASVGPTEPPVPAHGVRAPEVPAPEVQGPPPPPAPAPPPG